MAGKRAIPTSPAERALLLTLLYERLEEGSYYGNRRQFMDRLKRLIAKIEAP